MTALRGLWKHSDFGLEKPLSSQTLVSCSVGTSRTLLREMQMVEAWLVKFQEKLRLPGSLPGAIWEVFSMKKLWFMVRWG